LSNKERGAVLLRKGVKSGEKTETPKRLDFSPSFCLAFLSTRNIEKKISEYRENRDPKIPSILPGNKSPVNI